MREQVGARPSGPAAPHADSSDPLPGDIEENDPHAPGR
jgi:hypothetical protein